MYKLSKEKLFFKHRIFQISIPLCFIASTLVFVILSCALSVNSYAWTCQECWNFQKNASSMVLKSTMIAQCQAICEAEQTGSRYRVACQRGFYPYRGYCCNSYRRICYDPLTGEAFRY